MAFHFYKIHMLYLSISVTVSLATLSSIPGGYLAVQVLLHLFVFQTLNVTASSDTHLNDNLWHFVIVQVASSRLTILVDGITILNRYVLNYSELFYRFTGIQ